MKTFARIIFTAIILASGISHAHEITAYDKCERDVIALGEEYRYSITAHRYVEACEELKACNTDSECEDTERQVEEAEQIYAEDLLQQLEEDSEALDVAEGKQE